MNARRGAWALARYALAVAVLAAVASGLLYPGGTVIDPSTRGYSFTHNFLSDLGSTVTFAGAENTRGAVLFAVGMLVGVVVLAGSFVGAVRLLSAAPRARPFARLAAVAGALVCGGFLVVALAPADRAFRLHVMSSRVAFYCFPVGTALLGVATTRDARFRRPATVGWTALTLVLVGFIAMAHLGPSPDSERGLVTQVVMQKVMAATVLVVLWLESREAESARQRATPVLPNESLQLTRARSAP
ncbi:protein of unknown function DUF998 [Gemmatirosa kalamazoonensis]|uniref:DUF998 domain-containing protein n=1 Tax=Gemmatirosa kalamazoonensis TaxID=861299 RepID=W0RBE7_9BACT|nr:DUF998 domain-containing protein [Gemmatirosa kalamazoonensis]AHG88126.1 protein of unknown function DUF998 [Gemmatirosa kalamazoonensis]